MQRMRAPAVANSCEASLQQALNMPARSQQAEPARNREAFPHKVVGGCAHEVQVGVDEPGHDETLRSIDDLRILRPSRKAALDSGNSSLLDHNGGAANDFLAGAGEQSATTEKGGHGITCGIAGR